jgi:hypothetical protein
MPITAPSQIPRITVDGTPLRAQLASMMLDAVVDDDSYLPDMFELYFADPDRTLADDMPFKIGAEVEIKTGSLGEDGSTLLINGEVTAIEAVLDSSGSFLTITGYDQSHRLHRGRKTATFNDVTDSDVAKRVAQAAGLSIGTVDSTDKTLEHVSQVNETDWSFLQSRARESGYRVFVKEGKFHFKTDAEALPGLVPEFRFGADDRQRAGRQRRSTRLGLRPQGGRQREGRHCDRFCHARQLLHRRRHDRHVVRLVNTCLHESSHRHQRRS